MRCPSLSAVIFVLAGSLALHAQTSGLLAATTSVPPIVRAEGLSERIADVVYVCTGSAALPITGNLTIALKHRNLQPPVQRKPGSPASSSPSTAGSGPVPY